MSTHTVLIYLAGDDLAGGHTAFYQDPCADPIAKVQVQAGQAVIFHHLGHFSPLHSGMVPWRVEGSAQDSCKYVLRSDAMYRRVGPATACTPYISPPYDERPWVPYDIAMMKKYGLELQRCSNPFCQKPANNTVTLLRCSRCHKALYCSRTCQERTWNKHKQDCHQSVPKTPTIDV